MARPLAAFRHPVDPEKQELLRAGWESLPNELHSG
jgi:hypothetical protein